MILVALVGRILLYITYGGELINQIIPESWIENERADTFVILIRKLLVFVAVPFLIYSAAGFLLTDFGLSAVRFKFFSRRSILLLISLSVTALLFQYFLRNGSRSIPNRDFNIKQILIGLPLTLLWYFIEAGLIEEFFYRGILQSRFTILLKSSTGGLVIAAVIFGLSHAPGLYLRGAKSEGVDGQLPFLFSCSYTIVYMSVAGIFLGIVWNKTKNLWLLMALHAMVDLLPNISEFIHTRHI